MAFREKTTFVIGAGASQEFGLPVGSGLAAEIKKSALVDIDADDEATAFMRHYVISNFHTSKEQGAATKALYDIREGIHTAVSIDAFIHRHHGEHGAPLIERLGKLLIAKEVLKAEANSTMAPKNARVFYKDPNAKVTIEGKDEPFKNPDYTWIGHFFRIMCDGVTDAKKVGLGLTIICFNYDRCIEHYLVESIAAGYRITQEEALEIVENNITIIHPYGYLGKVHTKPQHVDGDRLAFGFEADRLFSLDHVAKGIRTYTQQTHDVGHVNAIHRAMSECKHLIFLGFGFNNQNMDLLRVKDKFGGEAHPKNIYTTGKGIYKQIDDTVKRRILDLFLDRKDHGGWTSRVHVEYDAICGKLFDIYDMEFTAYVERVVKVHENGGELKSRIEPLSLRSR